MAGDWIPMRTDLWDCPEVVQILSAMCPEAVRDSSKAVRTKSEILGAMFRTWSLFDTYTEDGILNGYTAEILDSAVGIAGWAANLQHVGWLVIETQRLVMPSFDAWLSSSAKARLKDAQRKRNERKKSSDDCPEDVRKLADKNRTREQNRTYKTSDVDGDADDSEIIPLEENKSAIVDECNRVLSVIGLSGNPDQKEKDRSLIFKSVVLCRELFFESELECVLDSLNRATKEGAVKNKRAFFHAAMVNQFEQRGLNFNQQLKRVVEPDWARLKPKAEAQACS